MKRSADRCGLVLLVALAASANAEEAFELRSSAFRDGADIPATHTCDGENRSPKLQWTGASEKAEAFALVMEDPDAPKETFTHWVIYNIPGAARALDEGVKPVRELGDGTVQGLNDFGEIGYGGPCPPRGEKHRYVFRVFALSAPIESPDKPTRDSVLEAVEKKSFAETKLVGRYERAEADADQ